MVYLLSGMRGQISEKKKNPCTGWILVIKSDL